MSRKLIKVYNLLNVPDATTDVSYTSAPIDVLMFDDIGIQVTRTGSVQCVITIQGTLDGVNYVPLDVQDESGNPPAITTDDSILIRITQVPYPTLRVFIDSLSGDPGSLVVMLSAKMI